MRIWDKLLFTFLALHSLSAVTLEFVPEDQAKDLAGRFSKARPLTQAEVKKFADRDWRCDMYGMRTRLQVEREVRLYRFSPTGERWMNVGAQMIQNYAIEKTGLVGRKGNLSDHIRVSTDEQLVAKLSMDSVVLAYSICRPSTVM